MARSTNLRFQTVCLIPADNHENRRLLQLNFLFCSQLLSVGSECVQVYRIGISRLGISRLYLQNEGPRIVGTPKPVVSDCVYFSSVQSVENCETEAPSDL